MSCQKAVQSREEREKSKVESRKLKLMADSGREWRACSGV